ncbi:MAG TPA: MFS transporter [Lacipirellulaceae bacterium]|jgi:MFS family permease
MTDDRQLPWYRQLTAYHWFVFSVASAAWFFDCLDQRLFSLARNPALAALMPAGTPAGDVQATGKVVTAMFLVGWGVGGLVFGALGDRHGRAKMLTLTVLIYSCFTGLTFFSRSWFDFTLFRFLTGVGIGGVFGLSCSLIAETVPDTARAAALGMLQVLSTIGNISAALCKILIDYCDQHGIIESGNGWRWMFLVGALPALLVIFTGKYLREPDAWLHAREAGQLPIGNIFRPYVDLVSDLRWRKNLIVGALIASTGVIGLWAIGEYAVDLQRFIFHKYYVDAGQSPDEVNQHVAQAITLAYVFQMLGGAVGMWILTRLAISIGRRAAFLVGFTAALVITLGVYWKMNSPADAYWMMPLMGGAQLAVFAGFAIYLPELFPSRLRSTGVSFCYNLGRFAAAAGSMFSAKLATGFYGQFGSPLMERYSAMTMCAIFLVGLATLPFAPETKGQPLPE